jgi:hypothetical protein
MFAMRAMFMKFGLLGLALAGAVQSAHAFSLAGPLAVWQDARKSFGLGGNAFGPMNVGEEYRYNVPTLYYAFDDSFVQYFGSNGVSEVEAAVGILNALPRMSSVDLNDYPLDVRRPNLRAQALNLMDLKSVALGMLVQNLGLLESIRYVFTLRDVVDQPCCNLFRVVRRNIDPTSGTYSSYINNQLFTYRDIFCICTPIQLAYIQNEPVDPLSWNEPVASMFSSYPAVSRFSVGQFYTGLTRDDVGGLKYIYQKMNQQWESTIFGVAGGGGAWGPPPGGTNGTGTNFITTGVRYGVDKLTFKRVNFDSLIGALFQPITNTYTETVITNGIAVQQSLSRAVYLPDILFTAGDTLSASAMTVVNGPNPSLTITFTGSTGGPYAIIAFPGAGTLDPTLGPVNAGPGVWNPVSAYVFNNTGPLSINLPGGFVTETNAIPVMTWASFGTSTNIIIYPTGASIDELESQILSSSQGQAWGPPGFVPPNQQTTGGGTGAVTP